MTVLKDKMSVHKAYVIGEIDGDVVWHIGVYTEERPTSSLRVFQFVIATGEGNSCEEATRRAAYNALLVIRWYPKLESLAMRSSTLISKVRAALSWSGSWELKGLDPKHALESFFMTGDLQQLMVGGFGDV